MPIITNEKIADALNNIADLLEEQDDNPYRVRAYRRAAGSIKRYPQNLVDMIEQKIDLTIIPRIGKFLSERIQSMVLKNDFSYVPENQAAQAYPKKYQHKKIKKTSFRIYSVIPVANRILKRLQNIALIKKMEFAGDYRRKKEVIQEIAIIIVTDNAQQVFEQFYSFPSVKYIISTEERKTQVQLKTGMLVTMHVVKEEVFAAALLDITGSSEHYAAMQKNAVKKNYHLTGEGLFKNRSRLLSDSEEAIYQTLGMRFIPPELRENRGEISAAENNSLPKLIELADIKGDLHSHTNETDGSFTLEEMVAAAQEQGYEYVAITDHSQSLKITHGMDEKRLLQQIKKIDALNAKLTNFTILKSMEIDILEDGSLDLSTDVLKVLDLTVCSVHSKFRLSGEKQTERIMRAMDNPYFNILGHATGRLIHHRPPYEVNIEAILRHAKERQCFIEVNAQPARLDINDLYCKQAKELGVKVAISSDAHTTNGFNFMILGVNQARRGWLEAKDVINTYKLEDLKKLLKRN